MSSSKLLLSSLGALLLLGLLGVLRWRAATPPAPAAAPAYISYRADLRRTPLRLYWRDGQQRRYGSLGHLRDALAAQGQQLVFAMNAGMFRPDFSPQGLFIENGILQSPLDTARGAGNFYLLPNGVFFTTADNRAHIVETAHFRAGREVCYATQSGPLLLIDGRIHLAFRPGSANRQIRNGVGVLPTGEVLLAMSSAPVSLYDFAAYFRRAGCRQALYLDGFVSRTYAPAQHWTQLDGDFGVIIGITAPRR